MREGAGKSKLTPDPMMDTAAETKLATASEVLLRSDDEARDRPDRFALPERLGPFRVLEQIGVGGMGVVYRGAHVETGQEVALKTVKVERPSLTERLQREIQALGRVHHPGVIRVVAAGVHDAAPWYAMELLGVSLRNVLDEVWGAQLAETEETRADLEPTLRGADLARARRRGLAKASSFRHPAAGGQLSRMLSVAAQICDALAFLHGEGVVHRDLKPANVLFRATGEPVITDFGLVGRFAAKLGREVLELDDGVAGSAPYMSPEQIRGELVDARSDLYALGCLLYEMVTGYVPFTGESSSVICSQHLDVVCEPASARVSGVPPSLDTLIASLLDKKPRRRVGHASDVALGLREILTAMDQLPPEVCGDAPQPYLYRPDLCGRDELVAEMENDAVEAVLGRGGVAFIAGESGVGKTRVLLELARRATLMGMTALGSECSAVLTTSDRAGHSSPLGVFRPLLSWMVDHVRQHKSDELVDFILRRGAILRRYEPRLYELDIVRGLPAMPALAAEAERGRVFAALREALVVISKERSLLLMIDDLQWADELSLGFLMATGPEFFSRVAVYLVGTYRADEAGAELLVAVREFEKRRRALGRLDDASVGQMVSDMLGIALTPGRFVRSLTRVSAGNPFFVAEYLRAAVAEGLLYRERSGAWHVDDAERELQSAVQLPRTLQELVERRLNGLDDASLRVARALAVVGREAEWELLVRLLDAGETSLGESLHTLVQRQVLSEETPGVVRFVHDQLREVAYASTPASDRGHLHGRVAELIEARYQNTPDFATWYASLAVHYEQADRSSKAIEYFERAGARALRVGTPKDAIFSVGRAQALAADLRQAQTEPAWARARRHRLLGDAHYALGSLPDATEHYLGALDELGELAPRSRLGWLRLLSQTALVETGALLKHKLGGKSAPRRDLAEGAMAAQRIAERYYFTNDAFRIVAASLQSVHLARRSDTAVSRPHFQLGIAAGVGGLTGVSQRCFQAGRRSALDAEDPYGQIMGAYTEIAYLSGRANWQRARRVGQDALQIAEALGDPHELDLLNTVIANVEAFTGQFPSSAERFAQIRDRARARGNPVHEAWGLYARAAALIAQGAHAQAVTDLRQALALLEGRSDVASEIISHGLLARASLCVGDLEGARAAADEAATRIHSRLPAVYSTLHGFHGATEVYLRLAALEADATLARELERAGSACLWKLRLFARLMPFGQPAALYCRALRCKPTDRPRAEKLLRRSARSAREMGMPYYEARALLELAGVTTDAGRRRRTLRDARERFSRMGCVADAERCLDGSLDSQEREER